MPNTLRFKLPADIRIDVVSDGDFAYTDRDARILRAFVPGIEIAGDGEPDFTIEHHESAVFRFSQEPARCVINDAWGGEFLDDLYHLIYGCARMLWLTKEIYPVHSICAGDSGFALAVGHSGAGKTSLLSELMRSHNACVLATNRTLVSLNDGVCTAVAGTTTVSVRDSDLPMWEGQVEGSTAVWNRQMFELSAPHTIVPPQPIRKIAVVRLSDNDERAVELDPSAALHALYPYFLDAVGADVVLHGGAGVFVGAPSRAASEGLARNLRDALAATPVFAITGSRAFVAQALL